MGGGGVCGRNAGIAHGTMIQAGNTIDAHPLFMERSPRIGEAPTGSIVGEGFHGTTSEYPTKMCNETGGAGKRTGIGNINKPGGFRICNPKCGHDNPFVRCSSDSPAHMFKRSNQGSRNNTGSSGPQVRRVVQQKNVQQQGKHPEVRTQTRSRQPVRQVQQRQSRPHVKEMKSRPPQQHQVAGPPSRKGGKQQNVQQQGKHKGGKEEKQGKR